MRVFCFAYGECGWGLSFKRSSHGLKDELTRHLEHILKRAFSFAVAILHKLHARYPATSVMAHSVLKGAISMDTFSMSKPFSSDRTKELLNYPTPTMELCDPSRLFEGLNLVAGQQAPVCGPHTFRRINLFRFNDADGLTPGFPAQASLDLVGSMTNRGEDAFDGLAGSDVLPVLGRKVATFDSCESAPVSGGRPSRSFRKGSQRQQPSRAHSVRFAIPGVLSAAHFSGGFR